MTFWARGFLLWWSLMFKWKENPSEWEKGQLKTQPFHRIDLTRDKSSWLWGAPMAMGGFILSQKLLCIWRLSPVAACVQYQSQCWPLTEHPEPPSQVGMVAWNRYFNICIPFYQDHNSMGWHEFYFYFCGRSEKSCKKLVLALLTETYIILLTNVTPLNF